MEVKSVFLQSRAWPFVEAGKILKKIGYTVPKKGYVLFETGYGPSGLPHIGTFGEVVRTTMIRKAFTLMSDIPTRLFCFSDDMDGMRKIPDTILDKERYKAYMDLPLTKVPDPFHTDKSFGHNMNARLRKFLDTFGFEYEFQSATDYYHNGLFNDALMNVLRNYDQIMKVMLPTLGAERRATYSPFLPICKKSGKVLQVPIIDMDIGIGTVSYRDLDGELCTNSVKDGHCKLQWKPDFGMRWAALNVDFEMYGKDHLVNGPIYSKICEILGGKPPHQMFYELFLDEQGQKISKSKGNGLTIDEWLRYAPRDSLTFFMYTNPQKAKKLYFDVIPKNVDEYILSLNSYHNETIEEKKLSNPVFHINKEIIIEEEIKINYSLLINLVVACKAYDKEIIWKYLQKFDKNYYEGYNAFVDGMVIGAVNYYHDFIKPHLCYRGANDLEKRALLDLAAALKFMENEEATTIQNTIYDIGKKYNFDLKEWFQALYEILLGSSSGPRFGSFIKLYGVKQTITLIEEKVLN